MKETILPKILTAEESVDIIVIGFGLWKLLEGRNVNKIAKAFQGYKMDVKNVFEVDILQTFIALW